MASLFKQIYRYTRARSLRHNENLWPWMKITRAASGEIATLRYKGQPVPLADLSALKESASGDILLTATGPSVNTLDFSCFPPMPAMGVNGAWSLHQQVGFRFYLIVDMGFIDQKFALIAEIIASPDITLFTTAHGVARLIDRFTLAAIRCQLAVIEDAAMPVYQHKRAAAVLREHFRHDAQVHFLAGRDDIAFSADIRRGIFDAGTVVYWALQLLAYIGFRRIFIIGLDMNGFEQPRFYESADDKQPSLLQDNLHKVIVPGFQLASQCLAQRGVRVINLSPHSAIDSSIFPKADCRDQFG